MTTRQYPCFALTIAGSDPSGGAGLQADLRTFTSLGINAGAVITCVTVQDSSGVQEIVPMTGQCVADQIRAAFNDLDISHVKIGMLGTKQIARAVAQALEPFTGEIVYDPVVLASSGDFLSDTEQHVFFAEKLLHQATMLTPNRLELEMLAHRTCDNDEAVVEAAHGLFNHLPRLRCLAVTGGHFHTSRSLVTDTLFCRVAQKEVCRTTAVHPRIDTANSRGTGCTFASALSACHQLTGDDRTAFLQASDYVARLLAKSATWDTKQTSGPMLHASFRN